jgi:hypothetical protein
VTVTGLSAMAANFHKLEEAAQAKVIEAQRVTAHQHRDLMEYEAPKDTGFMAAHTEVRFSEGGFRVEVGYWAETFTAAGLPFYVPYPLFGTSRIQANDWVFRATEPMRDVYRQNVGEALKEAVRETATE